MRNRTNCLLLLVLLSVPTLGCFKHTYQIGGGAPDAPIVYKQWHHHWLFGTIRPELQKSIDIDALCPSGQMTIHSEQSFVNGLISALIGVIYSPTTVTVRCEGGKEVAVRLDADQVRRIVHDPLFLAVVDELAPERSLDVRVALARDVGEAAAIARADR